MAKLYFYYSAMNAGKSTILLQSANNYRERGMEVLLFTSALDKRFGTNKISSRIGLEAKAKAIDPHFNFFEYVEKEKKAHPKLQCVLVDEAQFLTKKQVDELTEIVDELNLPVLAFGLRSDFKGEAFEGSLALLILADHLSEIKTICHCGKKAIMTLRLNEKGKAVKEGEQVMIGDNQHYMAVCRKHFREAYNKE